MRIIMLGNAGSGKSTLTSKLLKNRPISCLSLDKVAFGGTAMRRDLQDSLKKVEKFIESNSDWIIEGCYADLIMPILKNCELLIFLNPGIDICVAHCRSRPWESGKFDTAKEQNQNLENLILWVKEYDVRQDEYGLISHQKLYDSFQGSKVELNDPQTYYQDIITLLKHV